MGNGVGVGIVRGIGVGLFSKNGVCGLDFLNGGKVMRKNITTKQSATAWLGNDQAKMKPHWQQNRRILMMIYVRL